MRIEWIEKYLTEAEQMMYADKVEDGLGLLNTLLYDEPGYGSLHNHLGWAYMYYTADVKRAELHLTMAIKFYEDYAAPYLHLGNLYIRTRQYALALNALEKGLEKPAANRLALLDAIARVHELRGDYKKAVSTYKVALTASTGAESNAYMEGIKRCRKKRFTLFFSF